VPSSKNVLFKAWSRCKDFIFIALPLLLVGSIALELLLHFELMDALVGPFSFVTVTMLGLPAVTIIALILGVVRKEMALVLLVMLSGSADLAAFMSPDQFIVFGIVMATYMPCVATLAVLWKELGIKRTGLICVSSIFIALMMGTAFNAILSVI